MSNASKWDKAAGKQLWLEGKTDKEIAMAFGVHPSAVGTYRRKYWEPEKNAEAEASDSEQLCGEEQAVTGVDLSECEPEEECSADVEALREGVEGLMLRALELMTGRLSGMDAVMTAQIATILWNWETKADLLDAKMALDYLIGRAQ